MRERKVDRGRRQARRALVATGDDFREARLRAGLTQEQVGASIGMSHTQISRIERGLAVRVAFETLALMGAVLGLDVPLRTFPSSEPIRDIAQLNLLARLRGRIGPGLRWRTEVPLSIPGDRRAWDAVIEARDWRIPVDAESRLRDVQAFARRIALKQRDDQSEVVLLLVADTRHNRHVLRLAGPDLVGAFPASGRAALAALARAERPSGSAIVLI